MGTTDSKQKLGERVRATRRKLEDDKKMQGERTDHLLSTSPDTMQLIVDKMKTSFEWFAPFLEPTLLIAWTADAEKCKQFVLSSCKKVLSAPIQSDEYDWFKNYVLPSSIWMLKTKKENRFMYEELMTIVGEQSKNIVQSMDAVYSHLTTHTKWNELMAIENQTIIDRQDHPQVGLLKDAGIQRVAEAKADDDDDEGSEVRSFIDSNVCITALTVTAKTIDREFQNYIGHVMGSYGVAKPGPMKKVERSLSKLENDYFDAVYPKAAKLLDIVRCSVTFNTLEQLLVGYQALLHDMDRSQSAMQLARVKNGFLDQAYDGGYRDIKVNVVYNSSIHPETRMICEVQLLLSQFLNEKKRIHKLYSVAREQTYFDMVVKEETPTKTADVTALKFNEVLNVGKEVSLQYKGPHMFKCSVDSELGLLAMEGEDWFGIANMSSKKCIFETSRSAKYSTMQSHQWLTIDDCKYVSVQMNDNEMQMFKAVRDPAQEKYEFVADPKFHLKVDGAINFCDYDRFGRIYLVVDRNTLQVRSVNNLALVVKNIKLEVSINLSQTRLLRVSADGTHCVVAGGNGRNYIYIIDIEKEMQHKLQSRFLSSTYSPCFINGETNYVSVGSERGKFEVWNVKLKKSFKTMNTGIVPALASATSVRNILAIGSQDKKLRLYDVRTWKCFYTQEFNFQEYSLDITDDLKYVTIAGRDGDRCSVLEILQ